MDGVSIPNLGSQQSFVGSAAPQTEVQRAEVQQQRVVDTKQTDDRLLDGRDQEQARFEAVKQAAQRVISTNPLSNSVARFTIYRDTFSDTPTFITRFTSLLDGKVTIVREPELLSFAPTDQGTILNGTV